MNEYQKSCPDVRTPCMFSWKLYKLIISTWSSTKLATILWRFFSVLFQKKHVARKVISGTVATKIRSGAPDTTSLTSCIISPTALCVVWVRDGMVQGVPGALVRVNWSDFGAGHRLTGRANLRCPFWFVFKTEFVRFSHVNMPLPEGSFTRGNLGSISTETCTKLNQKNPKGYGSGVST